MLRKLVVAVAWLTCLLMLPISPAAAQQTSAAPTPSLAADADAQPSVVPTPATAPPSPSSSVTPTPSATAARSTPAATTAADPTPVRTPAETSRPSTTAAQSRELAPLAAANVCAPGRIVGNVGGNLATIDVATGAMQRLTSLTGNQLPGMAGASGQALADSGTVYSMDVNTDGTFAVLPWQSVSSRLVVSVVNLATNSVSNTTFGSVPESSFRGGWNSLQSKFYFTIGGVLYVFDPSASTPTNTAIGTITSATGESIPNGGDLYFDRSGNMYLVASNASSSALYRVDAAQIASGGLKATKMVDLVGIPTSSNANGVAFASDGYLYVSVSTPGASQLLKIDPASGAQIGATLTLNSPDGSIPPKVGDLGNCVSPRTLTVVKNIAGRATPTDQFTLRLQSGNSTQSATTSGSTLGLQTATQLGPSPVVPGNSYALSETPGNSGTRLGRYSTTWRCTAAVTGSEVATGTGTLLTLIFPGDAVSNGAVTCTVTNTPAPASLTLRKQWVFSGPGLPSGTIANANLGAALQAAGLAADAVSSTVSGVTINNSAATNPGWDGTVSAFRSDTVGVTETVTLRGALAQCSWQQDATVASLTSGAVTTTTTSTSQTFTGTLVAGAQTLTVTNTVVCTRLTLVKQVDNAAAGASTDALLPGAWGGKLHATPLAGGNSMTGQYVNGAFVGQYVPGGLTPFGRSGGCVSRPVARGSGQGDWSDHDEQQEASHSGAGRP